MKAPAAAGGAPPRRLRPPHYPQVLAGTAAKLYDFDLGALRPLVDEYGPTVGEIARPLTELPEQPNEALLRGVRRAS